MRRTLLAAMSVVVMSATLSLPLVLAAGLDPCPEAGDHDCPPMGDDCHDCARCSPLPATLGSPPAIALDMIPVSDQRPTLVLAVQPPDAPREPPARVPRRVS